MFDVINKVVVCWKIHLLREWFLLGRKKRKRKEINKILKRELEKSIALALESSANKSSVNLDSLSALQQITLAAATFEPIGRVVGDFTNIGTLKNTPVVDGDIIFIPSKPSSVTVVGEVMTPGSFYGIKKESFNYINVLQDLQNLQIKKSFHNTTKWPSKKTGGLWKSSNITSWLYNCNSKENSISFKFRKNLCGNRDFYQLTLFCRHKCIK